MGGFRYAYTCPDIDKNIKSFNHSLECYLTDLFSDVCPPSLVDSDEAKELKEGYLKFISDEANHYFENVREVNSDMRAEVERVLSQKDSEIDELNDVINTLERRIEDLEEQLEDWKENY